jgi:hypothetical protein
VNLVQCGEERVEVWLGAGRGPRRRASHSTAGNLVPVYAVLRIREWMRRRVPHSVWTSDAQREHTPVSNTVDVRRTAKRTAKRAIYGRPPAST